MQVHQEFAVHVHVSRPQGHGHGPQLLRPGLEAHARGPNPVAHRDLHPVQGGDAGHFVAAGEEMAPVVHVFLGIAQDLAFAGGAAGGVDAHDLLKGHGPEGEGVAVPQVVPGGERQLAQVSKFPDSVGADPGRVQVCPVKAGTFIGVAHGPLEAGELVAL